MRVPLLSFLIVTLVGCQFTYNHVHNVDAKIVGEMLCVYTRDAVPGDYYSLYWFETPEIVTVGSGSQAYPVWNTTIPAYGKCLPAIEVFPNTKYNVGFSLTEKETGREVKYSSQISIDAAGNISEIR